MASWAAMTVGGRTAVAGASAVVIAGVGLFLWSLQPDPPPPPAALAAVPKVEVPAAAPEAVAEAPAPAVAEAPVAPVAPPEITTWAVTATGSATIAGLAAPDALVRIMVDGVAVAETRVSASGEFAVVTVLAPNPAPSLMTLVMVPEGGEELPSTASVALGPIAGAEAPVAEVAVEAPAAVLVTEEGAVVLQDVPVAEVAPAVEPAAAPAPEAAPESAAASAAAAIATVAVAVETITYTPGGAVQLGGTGQPDAFLRVYLDNAPLQEVLIPRSGRWLTTLKDTAPGVYTLRVDQVDDAGKVMARFETPFKRETLTALAASAAPQAAEAPVPQAEPAPVAAVEPAPVATSEPAAPQATAPETGQVAEASAAPAEPAPPAAPSELAAAEPAAPVSPAPTPPAAEAAPAAPLPVSITVQPGHTLWAIARGELGDGVLYVQVFEANKDKIADPDLIYPGQIFALPER